MFYHCRPLKFVKYGKVYPAPASTIESWLLNAYKWLGEYCGYNPQIWLSRSTSSITGFRRNRILKKRKNVIAKRSEMKEPIAMFGFDVIKGFPVNYEPWETIINVLINTQDGFHEQNKKIIQWMDELVQDYKEMNEKPDGAIKAWIENDSSLDKFLKNYLFIEVDQVVVPSLNLKAAKKIICRNEKEKKALRKMGFIEDRIKIKNFKTTHW